MTTDMTSTHLRQYAILGAQARLREIEDEVAAIHRTFPELRQKGSVATNTPAADNNGSRQARGAGPRGRRGRRGSMSAAARKAASERMTKYWAAKRASADGQSTAADQPRGKSARATKRSRKTSRKASKGRTGSRKISAAGRKRISDAQKARWAKARSQKGNAA